MRMMNKINMNVEIDPQEVFDSMLYSDRKLFIENNAPAFEDDFFIEILKKRGYNIEKIK